MARKASILDVLREAQQAQADVAATEGAPTESGRAGFDAVDVAEQAEQGEPALSTVSPGTEGVEVRVDGVGWRSWLTHPMRLQRGGVLAGCLLLLALVWVSFELGTVKGRNMVERLAMSAEEEPTDKPGRMRSEDRSPGQGGALISSAAGELGPRHGYRIATFAADDARKPAVLALKRYLNQHLATTGVSVTWLNDVDSGRWLVAAVFPVDKVGDKAWQAKLVRKIHAIPPMKEPGLEQLDFAVLQLESFRGVIKGGR